ncbi:putative GEM-like protein 8 [Zea mays]|uniref:Putative GEM-like protein 8 n=1 Tax=Zea mays TaxID=4577 RepID=A0A3L6D8W2_MAIZE|nr:putative GEM-like protein 8 [Zea mays]
MLTMADLLQAMETFTQEHVIGIPLTSFAYADEERQGKSSYKKSSFIHRMNKLSHKTDSYMQGFKEHLTMGPKISETIKGKLSFGAKVLQAGGIDKVFREYFAVEKDEKLRKAFQCYLSTTAGPIAGMLSSQLRRLLSIVLIPTERMKSASVRENLYNPDEKYIDVVTVDGFDFWFMGFVSYEKSYAYRSIRARSSPIKKVANKLFTIVIRNEDVAGESRSQWWPKALKSFASRIQHFLKILGTRGNLEDLGSSNTLILRMLLMQSTIWMGRCCLEGKLLLFLQRKTGRSLLT